MKKGEVFISEKDAVGTICLHPAWIQRRNRLLPVKGIEKTFCKKHEAEAESIPGIGQAMLYGVVPKFLETIAKWEKNGNGNLLNHFLCPGYLIIPVRAL